MSHIMLDLETMGTDPYCPVIAIGACRFEMDDSPIEDTFYQVVSLESCMELGMKPSASTILWWMEQEDAARLVFGDKGAAKLVPALDAFTDWHNSRPDLIWGNSARFDCGILEAAYKVCGKEVPWQHWRERCYRTAKSMADVSLVRTGTPHNALDDAVTQAYHLRAIYKELKL